MGVGGRADGDAHWLGSNERSWWVALAALLCASPMMFALQGWVFIITNADGADNYKVVRAPVDAPQQSNWVEVVPPSGSRKIEDMDMFKVRAAGCGTLCVVCL